jgi:hypothetical protein
MITLTDNFLIRTHAELDLTTQAAVEAFIAEEKPDYLFLAAGAYRQLGDSGRHALCRRLAVQESGRHRARIKCYRATTVRFQRHTSNLS